MRGHFGIWALRVLIILCLGAVGFFVGGVLGMLAVLLLLGLVVALAPQVFGFGVGQATRRRLRGVIAVLLCWLGGVIGVGSALEAFQAVGSDPLYRFALWAGWVALLLPVVAGLSSLWLRARPLLASMLILGSGIGGVVCINLFYINTFYVLALPCWVAAVAVGLAQPSQRQDR
jgi:hypothetical protein